MPRVFTIDGAGTRAHNVPYFGDEEESVVRLEQIERGQSILKVVLIALAAFVAVDIGLTVWMGRR